MKRIFFLAALLLVSGPVTRAETVALWLFDEQEGLYPSCPLSDATPRGLHLILGRGGSIVPGKFGGALAAVEPEDWDPVYEPSSEETYIRFGLKAPELQPGRTVEPLTWYNNRFAALFTNGNSHLRRLKFENATRTPLNLGPEDWTVEFWLQLDGKSKGEGVVFEIGSGPRGENDRVTRLSVVPEKNLLRFHNQAGSATVELRSREAMAKGWNHFALTHGKGRLIWYLNGKAVAEASARPQALPFGEEAYFTVARDGLWNRPLSGAIDELRFSDSVDYTRSFSPPDSYSRLHRAGRKPYALQKGGELLYPGNKVSAEVVEMGSRKHLFLDDVLLAESEGVRLIPHPARLEEIVLDRGIGWSTVIEGDDGLIRLYGEGAGGVAVWTSFRSPGFGKWPGQPGHSRTGQSRFRYHRSEWSA